MSAANPHVAILPAPHLEKFSVALPWLTQTKELRLDASFYNPRAAAALAILERSGLKLARLEDVTERIFIPPRFKRIYVEKDHGVPFLQGSHVVHFDPADMKYLSRSAQKGIERWIIRKGWVLVTCSGTIGRTTIALPSWDGWAASQHILRIVPKGDGLCPAGYIYAYLSSELGQAQLTSHIYGAVVDEITDGHAKSVLIPIPKPGSQMEQVSEINKTATEAMRQRDEAVRTAHKALVEMESFIPELKAQAAARLERTFKELAQIWRTETGMLSVIQQKTNHPAYCRIIGMGERALPFILKELEKRREHWICALKTITGLEAAKPGDTFDQAAVAWLDWGKKKKYL